MKRTGTYLLLVGGSLMFMAPLLWMVLTSFKSSTEILRVPPTILPAEATVANYRDAFVIVPLARFYLNSVVLVLICVSANVATAALCAYGFARLRAPGRDGIFKVFLATMMLPPQVTMIPVFIMFQKLGWINSYKPLIVPAFLSGGAFNVFLLRQFFMTLPKGLEEAAVIDGCGFLGIFWNIVIPLSKPALLSVTIFAFMWHWNDFLNPLIYLHEQEKYTLALGLNLFKGIYITKTPWGPLMAAATLMVIPVVVIFFTLQRYFIEGIAITGMKG